MTEHRTTVTEILTDERGVPIEKPRREDYPDIVEYLRATHAYQDRVTQTANDAFDKAFRAELKRGKR
jgi:hypothetical protein